MIRSVFRIRRLRLFAAARGAALAALLVFVAVSFLAPAPGEAEAQPTASGPQLTYTKILKGSTPEYERIVVNFDGSGVYEGRRLKEPPNPRPFHLSTDITQKLFGLADEMHDFQDVSLESHKRVADLGLKTFKYVNGSHMYVTQFNYSTNRRAGELSDLFEGLGAVERHITALDYSMKYDHLGLPRELTLIQVDLNNKSLLDPQLMTGTLQSILHNPSYLHLAQVRAKDILQQIQKTN
ncbi:MAG: hypothetical protein ACRD18_17120 [Terriglobia bacterium]